ncbi:hypothetical protein D0A36_01710 [Xanthomonas campestris]|nr:hypothetical protein D0A41_01710 [Xanthomonas campestris]RFF61085.1 hypothetical protein D0A36_01710 [Xanthomonas campestris]RFF70335.1 hypothetical protein D0A39_17115 [Xanthomonas campestris pv. campestris]
MDKWAQAPARHAVKMGGEKMTTRLQVCVRSCDRHEPGRLGKVIVRLRIGFGAGTYLTHALRRPRPLARHPRHPITQGRQPGPRARSTPRSGSRVMLAAMRRSGVRHRHPHTRCATQKLLSASTHASAKTLA